MSDTLPQLRLPSDMEKTSQLNELKAASVRFLGKVKARLGEQPAQVYKVHETLGLFSKRELSKRETHKMIFDTLEGQDDLRQELMDILMHPAARWGPDEFDLPAQQPSQPSLDTVPQFLQPAHEPQIRLPSFSNWSPFSYDDQSVSLTMSNACSGFSSQQPWTSSPSIPIPPALQPTDKPTEQWVEEGMEAAYDTDSHDRNMLPLPVQMVFHNPWQVSDCADAWAIDGIGFPADNLNHGGLFSFQVSSMTPPSENDPRASMTCSQHAELYTMPTLLQQDTPYALYGLQSTSGTTPPEVEFEEQQAANSQALLPLRSQSSSSASQTVVTAEATEADQNNTKYRNQSRGDSFIHVLCGKVFASAMSVKKHHWGKRVGDLATTTGCWAKYKKPDTAWDDHPSCKVRRLTSVAIRSLPRVSKQSQHKASNLHPNNLAIMDAPQLKPLPGFPTFEASPHTVAGSMNSNIATASSAQEPDVTSDTHNLVTHSSFNNLLTAVNTVSQIDAPRPEGRAGSIALHLDAQVAAAEQHRPFTPCEPSSSTPDRPPYRSIAPAAQSVNEYIGTQESSYDRDPTYLESEEQTSVLPSNVEEANVSAGFSQLFQPTLRPSSTPARKKRKI